MAVQAPGTSRSQELPAQIEVDGIMLDTELVIDASRRCVWSMEAIRSWYYDNTTSTQAILDVYEILKGNKRGA